MGGENAGIADAEAIMAVERHTEALVTAQIRRSCRMGEPFDHKAGERRRCQHVSDQAMRSTSASRSVVFEREPYGSSRNRS